MTQLCQRAGDEPSSGASRPDDHDQPIPRSDARPRPDPRVHHDPNSSA